MLYNKANYARNIPALILLSALFFVPAKPSYATPPSGFTALGSVVPEDGVLGHVPQYIKDNKLTEVIPDEWRANEKWGTSVTADDEARGYIVFNRNYSVPVYHYSVPNNKAKSLSIFSSLGEYEPVTFALYPLKDMNSIKISVTDLKTSGGSVIDRENVDVRIVRSLPYSRGASNYTMQPVLLEKRPSVDLSKGKSAEIWVTFYAPKDATPGTYTGTIRIASNTSAPYELKLTARVLPIKLQEPSTLYGMCFLINGRKYGHAENLDKYFADMRAHGMNSMWTWPDSGVKKQGDRIVYDFAKFGFSNKKDQYYGNSLDEIMNGYRKAGFTKPWICGTLSSVKDLIGQSLGYDWYTPEYDNAYLEYVRQLRAHAKKMGWPPFSLHVQDEPSHNGHAGMHYAMYYNKLLRDNFPDVTLFHDGVFNDDWVANNEDRVLYPYLDIMCATNPSKEDMELYKQMGLKFWTYNRAPGSSFRRANRECRGVFANKSESGGVFDWAYTWWCEPGLPADWSWYIVTAPDGPVPTPGWESAREGIDDAKYLATLATLISRANASGKKDIMAAAKEASTCMATILAPVPTVMAANPAEDAANLRYIFKTSPETEDLNRWNLAMRIIKLQSMLAKKPIAKDMSPVIPQDDAHTLGMWHFDEGNGSSVLDTSSFNGSHHNDGAFGTIVGKDTGIPFRTIGISKGAIQFAPYTAPVVIPVRNANNRQFTYEAWINYSKVASDGSYFGAFGDKWNISINSNNAVVFLLNAGSGGWKELSAGNLTANRWYHIAATYDGQYARVYIDGILAGYLACEGEMGSVADKLFIGSNQSGTGGRFFGRIDEVRLSDTARTFTLPWE